MSSIFSKDQPRKQQICTRCAKTKMPTKRYLNLLASQALPYVCQACREIGPLPVFSLGKLGVL